MLTIVWKKYWCHHISFTYTLLNEFISNTFLTDFCVFFTLFRIENPLFKIVKTEVCDIWTNEIGLQLEDVYQQLVAELRLRQTKVRELLKSGLFIVDHIMCEINSGVILKVLLSLVLFFVFLGRACALRCL